MIENRETLRAVSWRDLCPWLLIFRTFGVAAGLQALILAIAGALLTPVGWWVSEQAFIPKEQRDDVVFSKVLERNTACPCTSGFPPLEGQVTEFPVPGFDSRISLTTLPVLWYQRFVEPFVQLFNADLRLNTFAYFLFGALWMLALWSFFGGAICRVAAMQLGREERVSMKDTLAHACRKWVSYFSGPILPLLGTVVVGAPIAILGLFMMADWGIVVAGLFWIFAVLGGFIMVALLVGLLFGWPLMWSTISAEGTDAFDALSRSYAYTFQRPLHYLFYAVVACVFGLVCWTLVWYFSQAVIQVTYWASSWGANLGGYLTPEAEEAARLTIVREAANQQDGFGAWLIYACNGLVRTVATAFTYSFFWCASTAIYLLLRRDVDQTELDEVWVEDDAQRYELPPIKPDQGGLPRVADEKDSETQSANQPGDGSATSSDGGGSDGSESQ